MSGTSRRTYAKGDEASCLKASFVTLAPKGLENQWYLEAVTATFDEQDESNDLGTGGYLHETRKALLACIADAHARLAANGCGAA